MKILKKKFRNRFICGKVNAARVVGGLFVLAVMMVGGFSFVQNGNPAKAITVTNISPNSGMIAGGESVTITGDFLLPSMVTPTTMQQMTSVYCANMPVFPAVGSSLTLTDTRDGQIYEVRKLADNNCWLVDNLRLGSTSGAMTLTSDDTDLNVDSNPNITDNAGTLQFDLPQLGGAGSPIDLDAPRAYGPVSGDTGSGATNYGYLYNWATATAGESTSTMSGDGTHGNVAPNSICPRGWRMPTGGGAGEFAILNGSMINGVPSGPDSSSDAARVANWVYTGAFKGVFSGSFNGGFTAGSGADIWSSSAYPNFPNGVLIAGFNSGSVSPVAAAWRNGGSAVRCIISGGTPSAPVAPTVTIDGTSATVTAWSDTSITFIAPAHAAGKVDIVVTRGVETLTIANGYKYADPNAPPVVPSAPNTGRR